MNDEQERALRLATEAGHILLENGAEITRVEETMKRIAAAYGVTDESYFVLSNGIITTGHRYAHAEFIPIRGTQLSKVVEVNQLSRDVNGSKMPLDELEARLRAIRTSKSQPNWEVTLGALTVATLSGVLAVVLKCPTTVFLVCGIIPTVPGGDIFWTIYYLVGDQLRLAATTGFTALKVAIAIAGGIILAGAVAARIQKRVFTVSSPENAASQQRKKRRQ